MSEIKKLIGFIYRNIFKKMLQRAELLNQQITLKITLTKN